MAGNEVVFIIWLQFWVCMEHIELFAGCGGLSLGLESAGFHLLFANELSPMAAETFAYNLLGEDLSGLAKSGRRPSSVCWLNSRFSANDLASRMRENPQLAPVFGQGHCEVGMDLEALKGKMIVGSIRDLNKHLTSAPSLVKQLQKRDVTLVSGGPPCQSFSLAGLRQLGNDRNTLPMDFAQFVDYVRPKVALLENVTGILRPFSLPDGKHYAWFEVARAFVAKGYVPLCLHVNAKFVGAAQNRPRFILLAIRKNVFDKIFRNVGDLILVDALAKSKSFFEKEISNQKVEPFVDLGYYDLEKSDPVFTSGILHPLTLFRESSQWKTASYAIDDLRENYDGAMGMSGYPKYLNKELVCPEVRKKALKRRGVIPNHEHRSNNELVRQRFCLYQILGDATNYISRDVVNYLQNPDSYGLGKESVDYLLQQKFYVGNGQWKIISRSSSLLSHLAKLKTKKQTQRVLQAGLPAPAALSIPDDACHYDKALLRTLTVREMARFQSFPDWFEFRSKVTTGGQMRRFEVPQYTQVGNAVPPLLGKALGKVVMNILGLAC